MKSIATLFALLALAAADPGDPCDDGRSGTCELISDCTAQGRYTVSNLCTSGADATRSDVKVSEKRKKKKLKTKKVKKLKLFIFR